MTIPPGTMIDLKCWLDQLKSWIHQDESESKLQRPYKHLLKLMKEAKDKKETGKVWDYIDEVEKLTPHMTDTFEQGEAFIYCAKMAADLENIKGAQHLFQAAEIKFKSYPHQHAVTLWMAGCIYWVSQQQVDAISTWEESIELFKTKKTSVETEAAKAQWYKDIIPKLEIALESAIKHEKLPACNLDSDPDADPPSDPASASAPGQEAEPVFQDSLRWMFCPITDTVPAGQFGSAGFNPEPITYPEFREAIIDNDTYQIYSITHAQGRQKQVPILFHDGYVIMRVTGNSMNMSQPIPIEDGDYIFVHQQSTAEDHEIVVAQIYGQNNRATVKRLKRRHGKILLVPESDDSNYYALDWEREFDAFDIGFNVLGVVKAIFKKKKE